MIESMVQTGNRINNEAKQKDILKHSHHVDILLLFLTVIILFTSQYVSMFSCLIRADYNLPIAFFAYFLKQQKLNITIVKLVILPFIKEISLFIVSVLFDLVYAILDVRVWFKTDDYQPIWQTIYPMHAFVSGTFLL